MKGLYEKWCSINLILRILVGLVIGTVLALIIPNILFIEIIGELFVGALKAIAPILVMVLVISSLASSKGNVGGRMKTVVILYLGTTLLAAAVSVVMSYLFPVHITLSIDPADYASSTLEEVLLNLVIGIVSNPVLAIINANYLSILFWSVLFGFSIRKIGSPTVTNVMSELSEIVSNIVRVIIQFAPIGLFGIIYTTVSAFGLSIFEEYAALICLLVACMLIVMFIVSPLVSGILMRRNPFPLLFACLRGSAVTAFFTRSSAANIPMNMTLCEKLGLDRDFYSVSIPLGSAINMNGAAVTITVMTLVGAFSIGLDVPIVIAFALCFLATLAACGASGVSGGSLLLIPMACSLLGIGDDIAMQLVAVGFIIGVIQDSLETAINSSNDVLYSATAEVVDARKRGETLELDTH